MALDSANAIDAVRTGPDYDAARAAIRDYASGTLRLPLEQDRPGVHAPTRRDFLYGLGASLGSVAFTDLLAAESQRAAAPPAVPDAGDAPLAPQPPHHRPRA